MKDIIKNIFSGLYIIGLALSSEIFIVLGIICLTQLHTLSAWEAIFIFVVSLISIIMGIGIMWVLGGIFREGNKK
jgi:hypothetical protein